MPSCHNEEQSTRMMCGVVCASSTSQWIISPRESEEACADTHTHTHTHTHQHTHTQRTLQTHAHTHDYNTNTTSQKQLRSPSHTRSCVVDGRERSEWDGPVSYSS